MKKPENKSSTPGHDRGDELCTAGEHLLPAPTANILSRAWTKLRSWFEVPYGYEDETGFHYGHEPLPIQASAISVTFHEVFTDRAHDTAMFMAATSKQTSPPPQPEATPREKPETAVKVS